MLKRFRSLKLMPNAFFLGGGVNKTNDSIYVQYFFFYKTLRNFFLLFTS